MKRTLHNLSRSLPATVGICLGLVIPAPAEDSDSGSRNKTGEQKRGYTKVLQIYDPGLRFSDKKRKKDKGVDRAAKSDWRDMLDVPHEPLPARAPRPPTRSRPEEDDEDEDDWLLHITDPDGRNKDDEDSQDPWGNDVLSDPYKQVFGHDVQDAIEQMAEPQDSEEELDSEDGTLEEEDELARDDSDSRDLNVYEPVLSESYHDDESDRMLDPSLVDAEELARQRLEQGDRGGSMKEEEEDTVLTGTWATLRGGGENGLGVQSSSDGLLTQTRKQLNTMADGFSVFSDHEDAALGNAASQASFFSRQTDADLEPGRIDDNRTSRFGRNEPFADRNFGGDARFDSTFDNRDATYGTSGESFGEASMNFGDEPSFTFNDSFSGGENQGIEGAASIDTWGNASSANDIRQQGPKDRFGQSDPFGNQSERFKFLE